MNTERTSMFVILVATAALFFYFGTLLNGGLFGGPPPPLPSSATDSTVFQGQVVSYTPQTLTILYANSQTKDISLTQNTQVQSIAGPGEKGKGVEQGDTVSVVVSPGQDTARLITVLSQGSGYINGSIVSKGTSSFVMKLPDASEKKVFITQDTRFYTYVAPTEVGRDFSDLTTGSLVSINATQRSDGSLGAQRVFIVNPTSPEEPA